MIEFIKDNLTKFLFLLIGVLLVVLILVHVFDLKLINREESNEYEEVAIVEEIEQDEVEEPVLEEVKQVKVDIKGAVKKPGVYVVNEGSIVNDVIELAGGFSKGGTAKNINLSKKVQDEMVIYIYTSYQLNRMKNDNKISEDCKTNIVDISSCEGASIIIPGDNSITEENTIDGKVSLNTASKEQLMSVSGIGESKALAIIEYREKNGGFKSIEELLNVSGIGESIFNKVKDHFKL